MILKCVDVFVCRKVVRRKGDPLRISRDVSNAARSGKVLPTSLSQSRKRISSDNRQIGDVSHDLTFRR